jgi:hypothetical protein
LAWENWEGCQHNSQGFGRRRRCDSPAHGVFGTKRFTRRWGKERQ